MNENEVENRNPVQIIRDDRDGSIAASIWLCSTKVGYFYDVTVSRAYRISGEECGYSTTFGDRNLDAVLRVLAKAKYWIAEQKQNAVTCTGMLDGEGEYAYEQAT